MRTAQEHAQQLLGTVSVMETPFKPDDEIDVESSRLCVNHTVELFYRFLPIIAFSHQHPDISIHFYKQVNYRLGIFNRTNVRQPILEFAAYHERIVEELIDSGIGLNRETKERFGARE